MSWGEVKHAINKTLGTGEFKSIDEMIGKPEPATASRADLMQYLKMLENNITTLTTTVNAINTRTNTMNNTITTINTNSNNLVNRGTVKSVQSGVSAGNVGTIKISTVNINKILVLLDSSQLSSDGGFYGPTLISKTATSINVTQCGISHGTAGFTPRNFSWQVIEFY